MTTRLEPLPHGLPSPPACASDSAAPQLIGVSGLDAFSSAACRWQCINMEHCYRLVPIRPVFNKLVPHLQPFKKETLQRFYFKGESTQVILT